MMSASGRGNPGDAPKRRLPELSSEGRGLARRVVQDRSTKALSRASSNGPPFLWPARRISTRKDRAGAAWGPLGEALRGEGSRVGGLSGCLRERNPARLYILGRGWRSVCELLDSARSPTGRRERASKETEAVT